MTDEITKGPLVGVGQNVEHDVENRPVLPNENNHNELIKSGRSAYQALSSIYTRKNTVMDRLTVALDKLALVSRPKDDKDQIIARLVASNAELAGVLSSLVSEIEKLKK